MGKDKKKTPDARFVTGARSYKSFACLKFYKFFLALLIPRFMQGCETSEAKQAKGQLLSLIAKELQKTSHHLSWHTDAK
ncbi:MAG: hypothetical protein Q3X14_05345, partial [Eggerthellaceae bacterium]|nr:hypothetical protein [Eggerthellaceae bacterium]